MTITTTLEKLLNTDWFFDNSENNLKTNTMNNNSEKPTKKASPELKNAAKEQIERFIKDKEKREFPSHLLFGFFSYMGSNVFDGIRYTKNVIDSLTKFFLHPKNSKRFAEMEHTSSSEELVTFLTEMSWLLDCLKKEVPGALLTKIELEDVTSEARAKEILLAYGKKNAAAANVNLVMTNYEEQPETVEA